MALFQKGIILEQHKEPAFSRNICEFLNSSNPVNFFDDYETSIEEISNDDIIEFAKLANIYDETDGILLYKKLVSAKSKSVVTVVADAIDDEPYISSQICPTIQLSEQLAGGLKFAKQAISAKRIYVATYQNVGEINTKIPSKIDGDVEIRQINGRYPAEQRAKKKLRYRNALIIGAGALIHLFRAVKYRRIQTTTFITVAGDCIANPTNLEVSLGMTVTQVLERCGLIDLPNRVVIGGSMTGIGVIDTDKNLITPMTRSVLAFKDKFIKYNYNCIGCGRCTQYCPMGLSPYYIYKLIKSNQLDKLDRFDATSCIGCGICSYNCPAKLELSTVIFNYVKSDAGKQAKKGKELLQEKHQAQTQAQPQKISNKKNKSHK
ncbi:MAG: 4Fe-4S dicluster domain-containing protein [Oscillospiraceae bacterium]